MHTVKRYVIDRIEEGRWAVLESTSGKTIDLPVEWLPKEASEGDVLHLDVKREDGASELSFTIDNEATGDRRRRLREKRDQLRRGPEGDFRL